ncbi:MAG: hypothetical protein ACYSOV_11065, partial [Planctomycetota bacterium]
SCDVGASQNTGRQLASKREVMKAVICFALICLIDISGCAENYHWTDYCDEYSADRVVEGQEREDYNPYITPASWITEWST